QDVRDFRTMFGLPANDPVIILNGADPGLVSGDEGEADLDVEWSGAVAPKATIKFVVSESEQTDAIDGVDASAMFIVDNNIAPVMSESFGSCESAQGTAGNAFQNALWQQAAAEGITVSVSSGDNGSAGCDNPNGVTSATKGIAVSGTASTPFNVAVGGTDFDDSGTQNTFWNPTNASSTQASAIGYIPEIPWNDSCAAAGLSGCNTATTNTNLNIVAGSGGPSAVYSKAQAPFQATFGDGQRDLPDISLFAADGLNKSFYIVCQSDQNIAGDTGCNLTKFVTTAPFHDFQAVGGTSASAPAFAGIMALVNQKTGQRQGNANFELYNLAKSENFASCNSSSFTIPATALPNTCVFLDVTKSNNAVACAGASPNCSKTTAGGNGVLQTNSVPAFTSGVGYDLATGLGSINVTALLNSWATPTGKATTTTLGPPSINASVGIVQVLSGTVTSGAGTPTGIVVIENVATGAAIDRVSISNTGLYTISTTFLPGGSYSVKARYGGDGTFGPSESAPITVNETRVASKTVVSFVASNGSLNTTPQTVAYGSPYFLRVDVQRASDGATCENISSRSVTFVCPTGTITLFDNSAALNDFPTAQTAHATNVANLNNRGFIEDQPIQLNVGAHSITANYSGDASYIPQAGSTALSVTITQAATQTTVVSSPSSIMSGGTVTLTATVGSNSNADQAHAPSGTVQFSNGSATLGAPITCTQVGASSSAGASCTAKLTTAIAFLLPPSNPNNRIWRTPLEWLAALAIIAALLLFAAALRMKKFRHAYAYAAIGFFLVATAALAGCSGAGSGGGGGGGGNARTITAKYGGDMNYAASSGTGSVTVQ
ncbi:MAG: Ig-like domain repeat protein, partial [Acidobacteria bacterium]|nr:Ig-like domain repeat protein [Acidobacteriota bacterium]